MCSLARPSPEMSIRLRFMTRAEGMICAQPPFRASSAFMMSCEVDGHTFTLPHVPSHAELRVPALVGRERAHSNEEFMCSAVNQVNQILRC
ncbi:hypothetical protein CBOM_07547 [Ceraceosorus bombacis]|uniref:Uncharacterized protein n=1 Tax=Ceraceosorus bombacis TaxID=401625 RepID=A0A0P1BFR9_9BASI|nr:hypothetical protein CBOM_07547 [Ceraceosorus bombacis]